MRLAVFCIVKDGLLQCDLPSFITHCKPTHYTTDDKQAETQAKIMPQDEPADKSTLIYIKHHKMPHLVPIFRYKSVSLWQIT